MQGQNPFYTYSERPLVRTPGTANLAPIPKFQLSLFSMLGRGAQGILQPLQILEGAMEPGAKILVYAGVLGVPAGQLDLAGLTPEQDYENYLSAPAGGA